MEATSHSAQFLGGKARHTTITLDWPVEFEGKTYTAIGLRRLTAGEVSAYVETIREMVKIDPDGTARPPIFTTEDGAALPNGLFDVLDDDDALRLDEAAEDFLPRRFRGERATVSIQTDGADTAPTS